jgi:ornithine cyclodeaminase
LRIEHFALSVESFLAFDAAEVERLLPMRECIDLMARAFVDLERGDVTQPLRSIFTPPDPSTELRAGSPVAMVWMPAYRWRPQRTFGMKVLRVVADNPTRGLDTHQGQVLVADGETGQLRALLDASAVTAIRTAAVSALATRLLAREDARVLAVIGTGTQARRHIESIPLVRDIREIRVAGRDRAHAEQLADEVRDRCACRLEVAADARTALDGADIVVTATSSPTPVIERAWLAPGAHLNGVGASRVTNRELDVDTLADALLFTDRRESIENEAGDYRLAVEQRRITTPPRELGELLTGKVEGRASSAQLTVFRSLGLAVEDLVAAEYVLDQATGRGLGTA